MTRVTCHVSRVQAGHCPGHGSRMQRILDIDTETGVTIYHNVDIVIPVTFTVTSNHKHHKHQCTFCDVLDMQERKNLLLCQVDN